MSRKAWSNVLLILAAVNLALTITPNIRMRAVYVSLLLLFLALSVVARRKMI